MDWGLESCSGEGRWTNFRTWPCSHSSPYKVSSGFSRAPGERDEDEKIYLLVWLPPGFPSISAGKESACNTGDPGSIPGLGRFPGEGIGYPLQYPWASLVAQMVKNLPTMWETWVWPLAWEGPLEEGMATHFSILSWRIPTDRGAWRPTVQEVAESDMTEWLSTAQWLPLTLVESEREPPSSLFSLSLSHSTFLIRTHVKSSEAPFLSTSHLLFPCHRRFHLCLLQLFAHDFPPSLASRGLSHQYPPSWGPHTHQEILLSRIFQDEPCSAPAWIYIWSMCREADQFECRPVSLLLQTVPLKLLPL